MPQALSPEMIANHLYVLLRTRFPGVRFYVHGEAVLDVGWTDGPEESVIREITDGLDFDAGEITIDDRGIERTGRSPVRALFLDRFFSPEVLAEASALWAEESGVPADNTANWVTDHPELTVLEHVIPAGGFSFQLGRIAGLLVARRTAQAAQQ